MSHRTLRRTGILAIATCFALLLTGAGPAGNSGRVLPPTAHALGWSLDDMAAAVANFSISGNDLAYYPNTPFQILYRLNSVQDPTGQNTFHVRPGTPLYAKFFFIDDSFPVIGDWPENKDEAADYIFGRDQLGAHDFEVIVDGRPASLDDPGYIGGPVETPTSPDGSEHMIQIGAFITPLNKGRHTIVVRGTVDGDAFVNFVGGPWSAQITYTVVVE